MKLELTTELKKTLIITFFTVTKVSFWHSLLKDINISSELMISNYYALEHYFQQYPHSLPHFVIKRLTKKCEDLKKLTIDLTVKNITGRNEFVECIKNIRQLIL